MNDLVRWESLRQKNQEVLAPRDPVLLAALGLDRSVSMHESGAIKEVETGKNLFREFATQHPRLCESTQIATYQFALDRTTEQVHPYESLTTWRPRPIEGYSGASPIYEIHTRLILEQYQRMEELERQHDIECRTGISIVFTDGQPTDHEHRGKASAATDFATAHGIDVLLLGCGPTADLDMLQEIAQPHMPPVLLKEISSFAYFFQRFFDALRRKSVSQVGTDIEFRPLGEQGPTLLIRG
jgi:uncharacterized protein YegL